jgi:ABC-2 type transport system permease protein
MSRPGRQEAVPYFSSPLALAWRLQKGSFIGWLVAVVLYIGVFSAISPGLSSAGMSDWLSSLGGTNWADELGLGYVFIGVSIYLMALAVSIYAMSAVLRLKKEENDGRAELLLDKPVSRIQWMSSHVIVVAFCSAVLLLAMGVVGGLGYGLAVGNLGGEFWIILGMSVSKIPAVWSLLGITALLYGLLPRLTALGWLVWMAVVFLEVAWEGQLIDWSIMQFSPFSYAHYIVHVTEIPLLPLVGLLGLSAILIGLGLVGFRNRDVVTKA